MKRSTDYTLNTHSSCSATCFAHTHTAGLTTSSPLQTTRGQRSKARKLIDRLVIANATTEHQMQTTTYLVPAVNIYIFSCYYKYRLLSNCNCQTIYFYCLFMFWVRGGQNKTFLLPALFRSWNVQIEMCFDRFLFSFSLELYITMSGINKNQLKWNSPNRKMIYVNFWWNTIKIQTILRSNTLDSELCVIIM